MLKRLSSLKQFMEFLVVHHALTRVLLSCRTAPPAVLPS